jgi:hypothetical protein
MGGMEVMGDGVDASQFSASSVQRRSVWAIQLLCPNWVSAIAAFGGYFRHTL